MFIDQNRAIQRMLQGTDWPLALEPELICITDEDKLKRDRAILSTFLDRPTGSLLDYTLDGDHFAKEAIKTGLSATATSDLKSMSGTFDIILMYDVLDHIENPVEQLQQAKLLLSPNGVIVIRNHPWCSRHGAHLHSVNKAFAHLLLNESDFQTSTKQKIFYPRSTYHRWFNQSDLEIAKERTIKQEVEPFFKTEPLSSKLCQIYNTDQFPAYQLSQVYCDYTLKQKG